MKAKSNFTLRQKFGFSIIILIMLISLPGETIGLAAPQPGEEPPIQFVESETEAWFIDKASMSGEFDKSVKNQKLDTSLEKLASAVGRSVEEADAFARSEGLRFSDSRVQVHIATSAEDLDAAINAVAQSGGEVTVIGHDQSTIQAWLPVGTLENLAEFESVYYIRRPMEVTLMGDMHAGDSSTEAIAAMNADAWHTAGYTGSGVKVAIIDGGFEGYSALLSTDLPDSVTRKNFVDGETDNDVDGTTEHGTACAEIVYDIAPDAQLYLAKIATNLELQEAVDWAIAQDVDIISTSLGWYNLTPGDGTGEFEDLVQDARDAGILWLTAAANDRENHWGGLYNDPLDKNYHFYNDKENVNYFSPGVGYISLFSAGTKINIFLRWDDWSAVDQDFDLYLVQRIYSSGIGGNWVEVANSENEQNGVDGQTPTEDIEYTTTIGSAAYGFVIMRDDSNRDVNFEVFAPKLPPLRFVEYPRSLSNLADAPTAMTIAALDTSDPYPQESYSSEGPTNGSGGALAGGLTKPDLSGFANVSTESYGPGEFNGTSSATPHVSGAAALILSADPDYTHNDIQTFLEDRAVDMGGSGIDTIYGYGRLWLGDPVVETGKIFLPLILKNYPPPPPAAPVLDPINNPEGGNDYTVTWSSTANSTGYILQEDDNASFSSPTKVYEGPNTSKAITGKDIGTYYYRVKAINAVFESGWSNTESVQVTVELPDIPVSGDWSGTTNQGRSISWNVSSGGTSISSLTITVYWGGVCGGIISSTHYLYSTTISNNNFSKTSYGATVTGTFTSTTSAEGTYSVKKEVYNPSYCTATRSGTWTATPSE